MNLYNYTSQSDEAYRRAAKFSDDQLVYINNLACKIAEEIVTLTLMASDPDHLIKRAYAQGQLGILRLLIETSEQLEI